MFLYIAGLAAFAIAAADYFGLFNKQSPRIAGCTNYGSRELYSRGLYSRGHVRVHNKENFKNIFANNNRSQKGFQEKKPSYRNEKISLAPIVDVVIHELQNVASM